MAACEYTEDQLKQDALRFLTRADWRASGEAERTNGHQSHYGCAIKRGRAFMRQCCAHMSSQMLGNQHRLKYSDSDLITIGRRYQHKSDWKIDDTGSYQAAKRRAGVFLQASAHMTPKAHPYSGTYIVYAYEFSDKHAYIGLTFLPRMRHAQHSQRGPVYEHAKVCSDYTYKIIEGDIGGPEQVAVAEQKWIEDYRGKGWRLLNERQGGGLGTIQVTKWTKEAVVAEARKYTTKQAWIDGSQMSYRIAKREGWFEEASAHMPKRVLGVGAGRSVALATRQKQREAKLGKAQTAATRRTRSEAIKAWWALRKNKTPEDNLRGFTLYQATP